MSIEVKVPSVGESVTEVILGAWKKKEGDAVQQDEDLIELESEKATFDAPAPAAGVLEKILKQAGESAAIGEVIAYIDDSKAPQPGKKEAQTAGDGKQQQSATSEPVRKAGQREMSATSGAAKQVTLEPRAPEPERQRPITPAARRVLAERGLNADDIEATGPGGRLLKEDVLRELQPATKDSQEKRQVIERAPAAEKAEKSKQARDGRLEEVVPMSPLRRRIAARLVKAQQEAALLTTFNEVDMSAVLSLREHHQESFQKRYGVKLGFMSFFVKATVDALMQIPQLNAEIRGTDIVYHHNFDIGVAVATEQGLVVPVVRNAEQLSFAEIEQTINELAKKARDGKLSVDEMIGGTFTISNGGIYGSMMSTPIVNPPQVGVLGMHAIQERPVVREGQIVARPMMYLALSYDHRMVDGREAVTFLKRVKETIEEPARLLIEA